jgi:hypothetical protein
MDSGPDSPFFLGIGKIRSFHRQISEYADNIWNPARYEYLAKIKPVLHEKTTSLPFDLVLFHRHLCPELEITYE